MIPEFGPAWRTRRGGLADAPGLAILLVAILLTAGTTLSQLGTGGPPFPSPPTPQMADRSVPETETPMAAPAAGNELRGKPGSAEPRTPARVNVNTANAEALQALPGIGPALAERIVADREANGPFQTPEDLLRVPGIGSKRWERIRPLVQLTEEP